MPAELAANAVLPITPETYIPLPAVLHGGDYNPEQWPVSVREEDMRLMNRANWNVATLPVFGWVSLQPSEDTFTFEWLDKVLDDMGAHGIYACMATATASVPAWLAQKYPDVLVTDSHGVRAHHGGRHTFCPTSPDFRRLSVGLARRIAERYKDHPALLLWHVSNEYGGNATGARCFCGRCIAAFREWLKAKYGTLETLNSTWYMAFWGHTLTDWAQIEPPFANGEIRTHQALKLDWDRFHDQMIRECFLGERDAIKAVTPQVPVTTNLMGPFFPLNYREWAKEMDFVCWDNYPGPNAPPADVAFNHVLMRGLREGQPFLLMEQSPSQQNWQPYNWLKPNGLLKLQSFQAVANGADSVMYFQWRRGRGGIEKLHGAVVEHGGDETNRVFQEVAKLGADLKALGTETIGGRVPSRVAILWDWETMWALKYSSGPSVDLNYLNECRAHFRALFELGIPTEIVAPDADLSRYDVIVAPVLYLLRPEHAERINARVEAGATLVATFFTSMADENDLVFLEGSPGPLRKSLGLRVEETDALPPGKENGVRFVQTVGDLDTESAHPIGLLCDRVRLEGAETLAVYTDDFYAGEPAVTRNAYGQGRGYYLATRLDAPTLRALLSAICTEKGIRSPLPGGATPPEGVEVTARVSPNGGPTILYVLNHNVAQTPLDLGDASFTDLLTGGAYSGSVTLEPRGVLVLRA